jgi:hypothetical protein
VSAFDELRSTGRFGAEGAGLLYSTMRAVGSRRGFPPPEGSDTWDRDAAIAAAHDFLVHPRTKARLTYLALHATDDDSLRRLLAKVILNYLRDLGRATEVGRLILRIDDVLNDTPDFVRSNGRWRLDGSSDVPSTVSPRDLALAAGSVEPVTVPRWSSQTRSAPLADADSIVRLCTAVLSAANGSLATADLAQAMAHRLGLGAAPVGNVLDAPEPADTSLSAAVDLHAEETLARRIFDSLSDMEKKIMATAHLPLRDLFDTVGLRKSQARTARARTVALVNEQVAGVGNPDAVRLHVLDLARQWLAERTAPLDETS